MPTGPAYRRNRDLFSNHYLDEHLPETEAWDEISEADLREKRADIRDLWNREKDTVAERTASSLEERFIRPLFRTLEIPFEMEETGRRERRRPDYGFFPSEGVSRDAADRKRAGDDCYRNAVAVADARRWGRPLDTRGDGEHERDFENPSHRMHAHLQETTAEWAVLTNGRHWRLYHGPTSHRLDSYYEIDLPAVLERGDLEAFKYFYLFFRHDAFLEDASGDCFLDAVYSESNVFARELGADLRDNIYEAITVLSEGYLQHPDNDLDETDLDLIRDGSLVYLYRLIFVLYAEAAGREPLDTSNERSYSLHGLKQEVAAELDSDEPNYRDWQNTLQSRLDELFVLIDQGSKSCDVPEDDRSIPAYTGGLFRTNPDEGDSPEATFLAEHDVDDAHLARVVELLTRRRDDGETAFIDYSSLDVRHLGSIYEGLLEHTLDVADEPLALDDGEYVAADGGDDVVVDEGDVYLTTDRGERKDTGSYYTPEYVVEYVVDETLGPLVDDIRERLAGRDDEGAGTFADQFAERIFELKILDPAMGSGHFLTSAVDYLARELIDAQETQAAQQGVEAVDRARDIDWARRTVAQQCIYGVDVNPLAVELAKMSLWLRTLAAEQPAAFLEHHLKTGNALVGSDIEAVLDRADGERTPQQSPSRTRRRPVERVMDQFQSSRSIDNATLENAMEGQEMRTDPLYRRLLAMANVHTAERFGLAVPDDAYEQMTEALRGESWGDVAGRDWFESAQAMADENGFFHWELEFPRAFYGNDGRRKTNPGFDAVLGNPPWVATAGRADISANIDATLRSYLSGSFTAARNQFDLYAAFYEQSIRQSRNGRVGIVVPDAILAREQNEPIRGFVLTHAPPSKIVRLGTAFEGVEAGAVTLVSGGDTDTVDCADATETTDLSSLTYRSIPVRVFETQDAKRFSISLDEATRAVLSKVEAHRPLGERIEISRGEEIGKRADCLHETPQSETTPIAPGGAVTPYGVDEDELRYIAAGDIEKPSQQYRSPKLLFRQTSDSLIGTYDGDGLVTIKSAYNLHSASGSSEELKHILGVLNSSLLDFYHHYKHAAYRSVFPQINQSTFEAFPVAIDGRPDEKIVESVNERLELTAERSSITLDVAEHLGAYEDGAALEDRPEHRPEAGVSETMLAATASEWPNLKIGSVSVATKRESTTVSATARYKPDDETAETDRWGYVETEPIPALKFVGLGDNERALLESFLPYAAARGDGFANFRANATQSTSLLERLQAVVLPRQRDVAEDIRRFVSRRERAEELDERIEAVDRRIEERVGELYGLTEAEQELVGGDLSDG